MVEAMRVSVTASADNVHRVGQIHPAKHDAGVRLRRAQGDFDPLATVQANTYGTGQGFEGSLFEHPLILVSSTRPAHALNVTTTCRLACFFTQM